MKITKFITFHLMLTCVGLFHVHAQVGKDSELFLTLKKQDSVFFARGFNQCDLTYL